MDRTVVILMVVGAVIVAPLVVAAVVYLVRTRDKPTANPCPTYQASPGRTQPAGGGKRASE